MDIVFDQTCLVMLSGKYTTIFNLKRHYFNEIFQINILMIENWAIASTIVG